MGDKMNALTALQLNYDNAEPPESSMDEMEIMHNAVMAGCVIKWTDWNHTTQTVSLNDVRSEVMNDLSYQDINTALASTDGIAFQALFNRKIDDAITQAIEDCTFSYGRFCDGFEDMR
jgi:hypothetical protein